MTPTERERLLTEAEKEVSLDVTIDYEVEDIWIKGYVAGATAEHDKARNQAIQDCIDSMKENPVGLDAIDEAIIERFESLKNNQLT